MRPKLVVHGSGPGVTVQDSGRSGYLAQGLSRGGAADPMALAEGAALLGQSPDFAAVEVTGSALEIEATAPVWIALTGAPGRAVLGDRALRWNACHCVLSGERLRIGPAARGSYAYLHVGGGIDTPVYIGGRGTHLAAGLGAAIGAGARLPVGEDPHPDRSARCLPSPDRFDGGDIRLLPGPQSGLFPRETLRRFLDTAFIRSAHGNRQGVKLEFDGPGFGPDESLTLVSEAIVPGDIQITGDGTPYVLGPECQTIGGYPRIGTVVPADLPRVMQATPGSRLHFRLVTLEDALADHCSLADMAREFRTRLQPLVRDPRHIPDLLAHNFISGVTAGGELSDREDLK